MPQLPKNKQRRQYSKRPVAERFWEKVIRNSSNKCWIWTGTRNSNNGKKRYGQLCVEYRMRFAHRISWEIHFGKIPKGKQVLHTCDNCVCVNPKHLFLRNDVVNSADKVAKGRSSCGEHRWSAKLTEAMVREIRNRHDEPFSSLANEFGVSYTTVWEIIRRRKWKWLK